MRTKLSLALITAALILPAATLAADGVLEINATCAVSTGCFPGDAPGYPVTIDFAGSYRLTSDLIQSEVPLVTTPATAILIDVDDVTIDLGGFSIGCVRLLGGSCSGTAKGIEAEFHFGCANCVTARRTTVRNGTIRGMPGAGTDLSEGAIVENVRAAENSTGIDVGSGSLVRDVVAIGNTAAGINTSGSSLVVDSIAKSNGTGISVGENSLVRSSVATFNTGNGITAFANSLILQSVSNANGGRGLLPSATGAYREVMATGNGGPDVTTPSIDLGDNTCGGTLGCP